MSIQTAQTIGMQPFEQFIAEQAVEAIRYCAEGGAALMPNLLSEESACRLGRSIGISGNDNIVYESPDTIFKAAPELKIIGELLFTIRNRAEGMVRKTSSITHDRPINSTVHVDAVATLGISVLVPTRGPKALFAASSENFDLSHWLFDGTPMLRPEYIGLYGVRDVMLIRQKIHNFNGKTINSDRTYHGGAAEDSRTLVLIDYCAKDITVEAPVDVAAR